MSKQLPGPPMLHRDGTSQAGRILTGLDPGYVSVDERSVKDLLAFAREYAKELWYYNAQNMREGDWSAFLGTETEIKLDDASAFMGEPEKFSPEQSPQLFRPHFVLFLTFLKLLGHARQQLNTLTRRHLEFYYRQVLQMRKKAAVPDQVNILLKPAGSVNQILLPAGSLLNAGPDSQGQDRLYRTDRDIVVNHSQIVKLSSVYIEKNIMGIREARKQPKVTKEEAFIRMLEIALGDPLPGDPLPDYKKDQKVDFTFLLSMADLMDFRKKHLFMEFFELRKLMQLKLQREQADYQWAEINRLLEKAARKRTKKTDYQLKPEDLRNFDANFEAAVGVKPHDPSFFAGITEVNDIYELYDKWNRLYGEDRKELEKFVQESLNFETFDDFKAMMQIKIQIDNEWGEINRILEQAGRRKKGASYHPVPSDPKYFDPTDFNANLNDAVKPDFTILPEISDIDQYYVAIQRIERYFCMSAERFSYLVSVAKKVAEKEEPASTEWDKVDDILAEAHKEKMYKDRRERLKKICDDKGFEAMIRFALGEDPAQAEPSVMERLKEYVRKRDDYDFLEKISRIADPGKVTDEDWDRVYSIVEIVQRIRENFPDPIARKEEWRNLHPYEDATKVSVSLGIEADKENPRWKTFGQKPPETGEDAPPASVFGWAISSPILQLSEGRRTITLTLGFRADRFDEGKITPLLPKGRVSADDDQGPFRIELSTEKGWIEPDSVEVKIGNYLSLSGISTSKSKQQKLSALQFILTIGQDVEGIAPLPAEEAQINTPWPVLRLLLRQIRKADSQQFITHYPPFKDLDLFCAHVKIDVSGLTTLQIQNDESVLDAKKPFELFGTSPSVGSRFLLGHPEIVPKRLDSLSFHIEWMGVPGNLQTYYTNYDLKWPDDNFTTCISLIDNRVTLPLEKNAPLFSSLTKADVEHVIEISDLPKAVQAGRPGYIYERSLVIPTGENILSWNRYLQWELNAPDFQHKTYPTVAVKKSIEMAAAIAKEPETFDGEKYQVSPPYTPKLKSLRMDYTASIEIILEEYHQDTQTDRIFHIHPFGHNEIQAEATEQGYPFLPQYDNEGELYIGIQNVRPPQNLSILFQMAEGSADPDLEPVPIQWSYLSENRWISLHEGNILFDSTRSLINSGIIEFNLEPVQPSTRLPKDLYWIRAAIVLHSSSVCDTVAILAQAVSATFVDNNNAPDHYSRPLPKGSITGLAESLPEITSVQQPYTSYGGKMEEQDNIFYTRVSERLRHKHRALTLWDYEHLILERFPQIYKAKCLPANIREHPAEPGKVEIVIIPDIRDQLPFDPFEPKASADLIADIESYLSDKSPDWATVKVRNAHYIAVKVRVGVRFKPGYDEGYFKELLNEELNRYLSPWAFQEGADIVIGGKIFGNSIINFIDNRSYVDYVAGIKLFRSEDGVTFTLIAQPIDSQGYFVTTDKPDGVLVAARQHEIDLISELEYEYELFTGINYMKIELDFVVG